MNLSEQIRAWLKTQDGPRSSKSCSVALGVDALKVQWAFGVMLRDGVLKRVQVKRPCTYEIARDVLSKAEVLKLAHEGNRRKGRAISKETEERKRLAAMARRNERDRIKRAAKAKEKAAKAERAQATIAKMASRARLLPQREVMQPQVKGQSVDDWLANGGRVERLPSMLGARP